MKIHNTVALASVPILSLSDSFKVITYGRYACSVCKLGLKLFIEGDKTEKKNSRR